MESYGQSKHTLTTSLCKQFDVLHLSFAARPKHMLSVFAADSNTNLHSANSDLNVHDNN